MIKYRLKCKSSFCSKESDFDGWFHSINAFEKQKDLGLISCPICGGDEVVKALTTPNLKIKKIKQDFKSTKKLDLGFNNNLISNSSDENFKKATALLRTLKKDIEKNATFVGNDFSKQALLMKSGEIKEKPIYGHSTEKELEKLKDEGVTVLNIPWLPDDH